jgi:hypothetical protein
MPSPELSWIRLDRRSLSSLRPTRLLLADEGQNGVTDAPRIRWPKDLELASPEPRGEFQPAS